MFGVTSLNEKESFLSDIPRILNHVWINRWVNTIRHGPSLTGKLCGLGPWGCFFKSLSILFLFAKIDHIFGVDTCSHGLPITCLEQKELRGFQGTCPAERASAGLDRHRKYLQQSGERVDNPWFKQLLFRPHELRLQLENYFCRIRSPVHLSSPKKTAKSHLYIS